MACGPMRARSSALTMWRVAGTNRICSEMTSQVSKNSALLRAVAYPSARARASDILARPSHDVHAERLAIPRHRRADAAIAEDAERFFAQRHANADLPFAGLERGHLLRKLASRRKNERPGQLGRSVAGCADVLA